MGIKLISESVATRLLASAADDILKTLQKVFTME